MATYFLPFERPLVELERRLQELREFGSGRKVQTEIGKLERRTQKLRLEIFRGLNRWQVVQLARHPNRPFALDHIGHICDEFIELHGDRRFGDDAAVVAGLGKIGDRAVVIVGQQKGRGTKDNVRRNFGMAQPEGYRKALRVFRMAARFGRPIITFIDTPGAYPGIGAEERGQAEAIATNLEAMLELPVPIVCAVIGEGGSGGALGIGVGNRLLMLEHAIYSVISPEACSSILWRDPSRAELAAEALKLTAEDLLKLGVVDEIVQEAPGGAQRDQVLTAGHLREALLRHLAELEKLSPDGCIRQRRDKFLAMGVFRED